MKRILPIMLAVCLWGGVAPGQGKQVGRAGAAARDTLGMTCAQILSMSSAEWIAEFGDKDKNGGSSQQKALRAIAAYAKCYDARTDRLAASLAKSRTGPLMGDRGNFRDLKQALDAFTTKALASTDPPADALKTAYARLYEMEFRHQFYQGYESRPAQSARPAPGGANGKASSAASVPPAPVPPASVPAAAAGPSASAMGEANPVSLAKNHFGEILNSFPEDTRHELHKAFGDIVSRSQISEETRLAIYRYAIFLLEPASDNAFAPPPF